MRISSSVSGPFFDRAAAKTHDAAENIVKDLMARGEREVKLQLYPGHGQITGHFKRSVHGEMVSSLHGVISTENPALGRK